MYHYAKWVIVLAICYAIYRYVKAEFQLWQREESRLRK